MEWAPSCGKRTNGANGSQSRQNHYPFLMIPQDKAAPKLSGFIIRSVNMSSSKSALAIRISPAAIVMQSIASPAISQPFSYQNICLARIYPCPVDPPKRDKRNTSHMSSITSIVDVASIKRLTKMNIRRPFRPTLGTEKNAKIPFTTRSHWNP